MGIGYSLLTPGSSSGSDATFRATLLSMRTDAARRHPYVTANDGQAFWSSP